MKNHRVNVFYSEEDAGYIADIPDLKFCSAFGHTAAEAVFELGQAKELWLETARKFGQQIPKPR